MKPKPSDAEVLRIALEPDIELEVESLTPIRPIGERLRVWRELTGNDVARTPLRPPAEGRGDPAPGPGPAPES